MSEINGVLNGVRVVEFEAIGPVPFAGMLLSDMGAEVLRIDRTKAPSDLGIRSDRPKVDVLGRGKKSLALDLKDPSARDCVRRIAQRADIVLEGYRPGTMERLGLGPEILLQENPKLVYGRMTGWGQDGPIAHTAGHDINYIALSGLLSTIGEHGGKPVPPLNLLGDYGGGGMMLALGVVSAALSAQRGGVGQVVDAAMTEGSALLGTALWGLLASGLWSESRGENLLDGGAPWYDTYETSDGQYVAVGAIEERFYDELLLGLGLKRDNFPPRSDKTAWPALRTCLAQRFKARTREEWGSVFGASDACVTPVLSPSEAPNHAQMRARRSFDTVDGVTQPAPAPRFSATPCRRPSPAPGRGEGGKELLQQWGVEFQES